MKKVLCLALAMVFLLSGCGLSSREENLGVFTLKKSFSYDKKYYAVMDYVTYDGVETAIVDVYLTVDDSRVQAIKVARSADFWGYCWEKDTHNIWVQSGDTGVFCYSLKGKKWKLNESAERPDYIVSKYD